MFWETREGANSTCSVGTGLIMVCLHLPHPHLWSHVTLCTSVVFWLGERAAKSVNPVKVTYLLQHHLDTKRPSLWKEMFIFPANLALDEVSYCFVCFRSRSSKKGRWLFAIAGGLQIQKCEWKMVILGKDWWAWNAAMYGWFLAGWEVLSIQDLPKVAVCHHGPPVGFSVLDQSWVCGF